MPPSPPVPRRIVTLALVVAAVLALSVSGQTYLAMHDHGHDFWRIAAWQALSWGFWALLTPWLCRLCERLGDAPLRARDVAWLALLGAALIAAHLLASAVVFVALQPYVPVQSHTVPTALDLLVRTQIVGEVLVYGMILVVGRMLAHARRARRLAVREAQLEADVARARLAALRLEIQPHFLFNTLNSIAALIRVRANDQALKMLVGLGDLMRATLDRAPAQVAPLSIEMGFTRGYVELQQVRLGDRLTVDYAVDPGAESCLVPAFLLQPIVENALRHGVGGKAGPCRLEIGATVSGGRLRLTVRDDGAGLPDGFSLDRHAGTGLSNVRTRLRTLYDDPADLTVARLDPGGTRVPVDLRAAPPDDLAGATA
jgi:signal transduction histidine kinase